MTLPRLDNVLLVVDDMDGAIAFFSALGLEVEGRGTVEGDSVDRLIALQGVKAEIVSLRTPDGHGRIELDKFETPAAIRAEPEDTPVNALGIRRLMFAIDDVDATVARLLAHGGQLVGDVVQYGNSHRLAYVRGPEGIVVGLAQALGDPRAG
jgi:catechol 2,3-dioxygenase-like lactoylglutathione lyase family enzyme